MKAQLLCGLLLLTPQAALQAKNITIDTHTQGHGFVYGYAIKDKEDTSGRNTGAGIEAGFQFTPDMALYGGYQQYATSTSYVDEQEDVHGVVIGGMLTIAPHLDVFSQLSWHSDTQTGFAAGIDLSYPLSQGWQVRGRLGAKDESGAFFTLGLRYDFAPDTTMTTAIQAPPPPAPPVARQPALRQQFVLDVKFAHDKSQIIADYLPETERLAAILRQDPSVTITIEGHTSLIGSEAYNLALSQRRADAVRDLLITRHHIDPQRIKAIGYGEQRPVAYGQSPQAQQANRRVVALVYFHPKAQ